MLTRVVGDRDGIPFRERFRAWWEGEEPRRPAPDERNAERIAEALANAAAAPAVGGGFWTPDRIEAAQRIWGSEHLLPGGADHVRHLAKPLALDPSMSVVDLGAGLGGSTRLIHRSFGVWLVGYEADAEVANAGMALSVRAGLERKAPVTGFDPSAPALKKGGFDRIIARDLLHLVADKPAFLRHARDALKKRGQILLTDFVFRDATRVSAPVVAWADGEPSRSRPWSVESMRHCLDDLQFKVHIDEDESDRLREAIVVGWKAFEHSLATAPLPPELAPHVLAEGERWRRCVAALETGELRHYRVIASA